MKNITLFHSYNYVNDKFIQRNNNFYDSKNNLMFSILNVPKNKDLYSLKVERILQKKKYSKKKNDSFYTKHNIKIYIQLNYKSLKYYFDNSIPIPDFDILYKICMNNISIVDINDYVQDIVCINKSFNKKITKTLDYISNNYCFYPLNELKLDIINKNIIDNKDTHKYYKINGSIIFYDIFIKLIDEFTNLQLNNTLIICNREQKKRIKNIYVTTSTISKDYTKLNWDNVIILDTSINIEAIKYKKIFICINKINNIKVGELLELYYKYFNLNLYHLITSKLIYNLLNTILFRNYSYKITKTNITKIIVNNSLNINIKIVDNYKSGTCNICFYDKYNIKTKCNHYFCANCVQSILNKNIFVCPYCRCNNTLDNLTYLLKSKEELFDNSVKISEIFKYVIKKSLKKKIVIVSNSKTKIKYLKSLFELLNTNCEIYNIKNKIPNTTNIYFLEYKNEYTIDSITNQLLKTNNFKKITFNFFSTHI